MFELLSKAVVESKQKVNIPKLSKEEPEDKEENEKDMSEEERGTSLSISIISNALCIKMGSFQMDGIGKCPSSHSLIFLPRSRMEKNKIFILHSGGSEYQTDWGAEPLII